MLALAVDEGVGETGPTVVVSAAHRQGPEGALHALVGERLGGVD